MNKRRYNNPSQGGIIFEANTVRAFKRLGWLVRSNEYMDRFRKTDLILMRHKGSPLRVPIEIQVTLNGTDHRKLFDYLRYQRSHPNPSIKVYLVVKNLVTSEQAAWFVTDLFRRNILRDSRPYLGKVWMVEVDPKDGASWVDIAGRFSLLRELAIEQRTSTLRQRGTIRSVLKDGRGIVIQNSHCRYFAYRTDIDNVRFRNRVEKREVGPGTPVTFYPTKDVSVGPYFLARCVIPA